MTTLDQLRTLHHHNCIVCGGGRSGGWGLECRVTDRREVLASFDCGEKFQGYPNVMHGGVISGLLDGAMTNCLFAHGHVGLTGELRVRFRHPVEIDCVATIRAWIVETWPPFFLLQAELVQDGQIKATAEAKFIDHPSR